MVDTRPVVVSSAIPSILLATFLLLFAAFTLTLRARTTLPLCLIRLACFATALACILDIAFNQTYTLGSDVRDTGFTSVSWYLFLKAIDICVVSSLTSEPIPLKIVPSPSSAVGTNGVPKSWKVVEFEEFGLGDRLLYSVDTLINHRPGTSWILPWQQRSFHWSLSSFQNLGVPWGKSECHWLGSFMLLCVGFGCVQHVISTSIQIGSNIEGGIFQLGLIQQFSLTFSIGALLAVGSAMSDVLYYEPLCRMKILPCTAILPLFRMPLLARGLQDFWGTRWHRVPRRGFARAATLFPFGSTKVGHLIGVFLMSAVMHSWVLVRKQPNVLLHWSSPQAWIALLYDPGSFIFFLSQGLGMIVEEFAFGRLRPASKDAVQQGPLGQVLRWLWLWFVLLGSGRYYVDSVIKLGFMTPSMLSTLEPMGLWSMFKDVLSLK